MISPSARIVAAQMRPTRRSPGRGCVQQHSIPSEVLTPPPNKSDSPPPLPLQQHQCDQEHTGDKQRDFERKDHLELPSSGTANTSVTSGGDLWVQAVPHDRCEFLRVEARPADQGAIHVRFGHDARDVRGLHRATVEDPSLLGDSGAVVLPDPFTDDSAHLLGVFRRGDLAGTDCHTGS